MSKPNFIFSRQKIIDIMRNQSGSTILIQLAIKLRAKLKAKYLKWLFCSFDEALFEIRFTFLGNELVKFKGLKSERFYLSIGNSFQFKQRIGNI